MTTTQNLPAGVRACGWHFRAHKKANSNLSWLANSVRALSRSLRDLGHFPHSLTRSMSNEIIE